MRKRPVCPVCRCTPEQGVTHLDVRLLRQLLNREIHPIRCAHNLRRKAQKARILGELCVGANHPALAIKIWAFTENLIVNYDDQWLDNNWYYNPQWNTLDNLMAEEEAKDLGRRIDEQYRKMGHPDEGGYEDYAIAHYFWTKYYRKPEYYDFLKEYRVYLEEVRQRQATESLFNEGQTEWQPACSQYFFTWFGEDEEEENLDDDDDDDDDDDTKMLTELGDG